MRAIEQQTIMITGATDGLGRALARELAARGATLVLHGRSDRKGEDLLAELRAATGNDRLSFLRADFANLADVHALAERAAGLDRLDVLVNNAGIASPDRQVSADGHELTFQVDYLAGYVLAVRLAPLLARSAPARIVHVSSAGQAPIDFADPMLTRGYDVMQAYCQAKLAQIMLTVDLAETLAPQGVTANALHPATFMPTKILMGVAPHSTLEEGMRNTLRLITDPALDGVSGQYFDGARRTRAAHDAYDPEARRRLRELSEQLTGAPFPAPPRN
ncbi:SDR family NAD(P)-dependent oxidoreductase [Streptomyces sp. NPDC087270]|uniref:SDR family NAD(P)-dependent oxidoreductase n=1 Tax=Streptomyces sp. NPDC087270 TaxID=3365774 RepID=UPI0037F6B64B